MYGYGFQGQETDDEVKGEGNSVNYKYRMHDPRIGRFFAIDPLAPKYPYYTPYSFSGNKVIHKVELEGLEEGTPEKLYTTTTLEGAQGISENGFDGKTYGKYSEYNWFSTKPFDPNSGRAGGDVTFGLSNIKVDDAHKISTAKTMEFYKEALGEMGTTNEDMRALKKSNNAEYAKLRGQALGKMYDKLGAYMNKLGKAAYYLERDGTYAVTNARANAGKITSLAGNKVNEFLKTYSRESTMQERKAARQVLGGNTKFGFWAGRVVVFAGVVNSAYNIYYSDNKIKTATSEVVGWAAAGTAAAYSAAVFVETGPGAIIAGVIGGGIGYWWGKTLVETVWTFTFEKADNGWSTSKEIREEQE